MQRISSTLAKCEFLILGAGPAGISAADFLVSKGINVAVIDRGVSDLAYYSATGKYELIKGMKAGGLGGATQQWGGQLLRLNKSEYYNWTKQVGFEANLLDELETETDQVLNKFKMKIPKFNNVKDVSGTNLSIVNSYFPREKSIKKIFQSAIISPLFHYIDDVEIKSIEKIENMLYLKTKENFLIDINNKSLLLALGVVENTALLMRSIPNFTNRKYENLGCNLADHPHGNIFEVESSLLNWYRNYWFFGLNNKSKKTKVEFRLDNQNHLCSGIAEVHLIDSEISFWQEIRAAFSEKSIEKLIKFILRVLSTISVFCFGKKLFFYNANVWFQFEQNKISNSKLKLNEDGIAYNWQLSEEDLDFVKVATRNLQVFFESRGFKVSKVKSFKNIRELEAWSMDACHPSGTIPLSNKESLGVVDYSGKVHAIPKTHLLGASLFPTAGWFNPTLLIMAFSRLVVSRIIAQAK